MRPRPASLARSGPDVLNLREVCTAPGSPPACRRRPARRRAGRSTPSRRGRPRCTDAAPCTAASAASRRIASFVSSDSRSPAAARALTPASSPTSPGSCRSASCRPGAPSSTRNRTPSSITGVIGVRPLAADRRQAIATKLVSGVASRKPPLVGWMRRSTRRLRPRASRRTTSRERVPRRAVVVDALADGDQRRQGVADDRQPGEAVPRLRQARQLERQPRHLLPRHQPGQGARHQDRHREGAVLAVAPADRLGPLRRRRPGALVRHASRFAERVGVVRLAAGEVERGPAEHRRRDVAEALDRVAPAAVGVLMVGQPAQAAVDQRSRCSIGFDEVQGHDRRRGGEGRRGELADPVAVRHPLGEQGVAGGARRRPGGGRGSVLGPPFSQQFQGRRVDVRQRLRHSPLQLFVIWALSFVFRNQFMPTSVYRSNTTVVKNCGSLRPCVGLLEVLVQLGEQVVVAERRRGLAGLVHRRQRAGQPPTADVFTRSPSRRSPPSPSRSRCRRSW